MVMEEEVSAKDCLIYVVDDEEPLADMLKDLLTIENYRALSFSSAEDALDSMQTSGEFPTLLLSDFLMSEMNGMELIQEVISKRPETRSILISGNVSEDDLRHYEIQPDIFLQKPFQVAELVMSVKTLLGH